MSDNDIIKRMKSDPDLVKRMQTEFMAGLEEGFAGVPMEFPEGIRELGEFHIEGGVIEPPAEPGQIGGHPIQDLDDEIVDAEIIE